MSAGLVAIIGAGPYGLSLAAHLAARNIEHRIFGTPMLFWSQITQAGENRFLKSYCFGTNISTPKPGFSFADYSLPRGLETFEPCSIGDFTSYGLSFQKQNVAHVEQVDVKQVSKNNTGFVVTLNSGELVHAAHVILATGLSYFAYIPKALLNLPSSQLTHTARVEAFASFKGKSVAVVGAGQSALEAAALLHEAGASPQLIIRDDKIKWMRRVTRQRHLWQRLRSPISGLGTGPKAWALTNFPGAMHRIPTAWRTKFVQSHLPPEGAWWLRDRVEGLLPVHLRTTIKEARETNGGVSLQLHSTDNRKEHCIAVDHVIAGTGYEIDVARLTILHPQLRNAIKVHALAPKLNANFEASVNGLSFVGPASAMSFGPLFRFVIGAEYTAQIVSKNLTANIFRR